jgi:hypothetical protein
VAGESQATRRSVAANLIDSLLATPLLTVETVAHRLRVSDTAAATGIQRLVEAGILRSIGRGKRVQAWSPGDVTDEGESLVRRIGEHRDELLAPSVKAHLKAKGLLGS